MTIPFNPNNPANLNPPLDLLDPYYPKYPNAIKIEMSVSSSSLTPASSSLTPAIAVTLTNSTSTYTFSIPFSADPVTDIITWLKAKSLSIQTVTYYGNAWYATTEFTGNLTTLA